MKTIYKYAIRPNAAQELLLPAGASILSVGEQDGSLFLWALVETDNKLTCRSARVYGTGWDLREMPDHVQFVGTIQARDGFVWHVFAGIAEP